MREDQLQCANSLVLAKHKKKLYTISLATLIRKGFKYTSISHRHNYYFSFGQEQDEMTEDLSVISNFTESHRIKD